MDLGRAQRLGQRRGRQLRLPEPQAKRCRRHLVRRPTGRTGRDRRPHRRRQEHPDEPADPLLRPEGRARSRSTGSTCATCSSTRCATRSASSSRSRCCSPARSPTTSATAGSTRADEQVEAAARAANAHDFIERPPRRLRHRPRRAGGADLRRRAPAHLRRPRLPQGRADPDPRRADLLDRLEDRGVILDALDDLMEGRTSFMIAHRLSTVRHADQILVLEQAAGSSSGARTRSWWRRMASISQLLPGPDARARKRRAAAGAEVNGGNGDGNGGGSRAGAAEHDQLAPGQGRARGAARMSRAQGRPARDDDQDAGGRASSGRTSTTCSASSGSASRPTTSRPTPARPRC